MENEVKEVLEEGAVDEVNKTNHKSSKVVAILGIAAAGLLLAFRKKINTRIEKSMVKKLTKKGYSVFEPTSTEDFSDLEPIEG